MIEFNYKDTTDRDVSRGMHNTMIHMIVLPSLLYIKYGMYIIVLTPKGGTKTNSFWSETFIGLSQPPIVSIQ